MKKINISKPIIEQEEVDKVLEIMKTGNIVQGQQVLELEENFANFCNTKFAVAVNSGTAALHCGLYGIGITKGDEVITTPFTFVASANPITMQGATIKFVDVSEKDFMIDIAEVEKAITPNTKAVLPVSLYGQVYDYKALKKLQTKSNFKILEDACQSVGAEQDGVKSGICGDAGTFSLYATKNIMCGEGGILVTNDEKIAEQARRFRHHGQSEQTRYQYYDLGYNYRLTDLMAGIGNIQFGRLDTVTKNRQKNAKMLLEGLHGIEGLILPKINEGNTHVFHQFTIRVTSDFKTDRDSFMKYLNKNSIGAGVYYPKPLHLHPHFEKMGYKLGDFPIAERLSKEVLSLPVHPTLEESEILHIIDTIKNYEK